MDRFFGQDYSDEQVRRVRAYYQDTPAYEVPLWMTALYLLSEGLEVRLWQTPFLY